MDDTDRRLIALLRANARMPTSALARELRLSRSTVQDRMRRLERDGVIGGYTIRFNAAHQSRQIRAHVMLMVEHRKNDAVVSQLKAMPAVTALYTISGAFDLIAVLAAETTDRIDAALDHIGRIPGITRTNSSIILSMKFER